MSNLDQVGKTRSSRLSWRLRRRWRILRLSERPLAALTRRWSSECPAADDDAAADAAAVIAAACFPRHALPSIASSFTMCNSLLAKDTSTIPIDGNRRGLIVDGQDRCCCCCWIAPIASFTLRALLQAKLLPTLALWNSFDSPLEWEEADDDDDE